jgi:hypothetical protein
MTDQPADKYKTQRRSERLFFSIPIRVSATDPKGRDFTEDAISINVSRHGARIRLRNSLTVDDVIHITNLKNNRATTFRVVGQVSEPQPDVDYTDWGVETLDPTVEIWGVELQDNPLEETAFSAVLQCNNCTIMSSFLLTHKEVGAIGASAFITRPCPRCARETVWTYVASDRRQVPIPSDAKRLAEQATAQAEKERRAEEERRRDHRLAIQVPIRIRTPEGGMEISTTVDLSRKGLRFLGAKEYAVGSMLFVTAPYRVGEQPIEMKAVVESVEEPPEGPPPAAEGKPAAVAHVGELPGSPKKLYGVKFESR